MYVSGAGGMSNFHQTTCICAYIKVSPVGSALHILSAHAAMLLRGKTSGGRKIEFHGCGWSGAYANGTVEFALSAC
jgi:hypothetical protein